MKKIAHPITILLVAATLFILIAVCVFAWQEFKFAEANSEHPYGVVMEVEKDRVWFIDTTNAEESEFFSINVSGSNLHEGDFVAIENMEVIMRWDEYGFGMNGVIYEMYDAFRADEANSQDN